ncbi:MAG TPA: hypothetical protein VL240_03055 [Candidatus Binatia bacterium]|nr:hypothetical protein [Candidatus Binatia bacterium]
MLALALGQTTPAPKPAPWKRYCQTNAGFCFRYPGSWMMLGEVFDGNGVVIAPPQKEDRALWDGITLAMVAPPPEGDEEAAGLDAIVGQAAAGMRDAGENFVTLQRRQRTVAHNPAQMLKAQYREKSTGREWLEEVVFIEGPDNEIYSVALRCAPQNFARLEPTLNGVLASWRLPEPEAPAGADRNAPATAPAGGKPPADRFNP